MLQEFIAAIVAFVLFYVLPFYTFLRSRAIWEKASSEFLMFFSLAFEWLLGHVLVGIFLAVFAPSYPHFWVFLTSSSGVFFSLTVAEFDDQLVNMGTPRQAWGVIVVALAMAAAWLTRLIIDPVVF